MFKYVLIDNYDVEDGYFTNLEEAKKNAEDQILAYFDGCEKYNQEEDKQFRITIYELKPIDSVGVTDYPIDI